MAPLIIQGWRGTNPSRRSRRQSISSSVFIRVHPWLYKQERLVPHCHVRQRRLTRLGMKPRKRLTASRAATEYRYEKLTRSEEHTSELQSRLHLVCRLLLEKKKKMVQTIRENHLRQRRAPTLPRSCRFVLPVLRRLSSRGDVARHRASPSPGFTLLRPRLSP